MPQRSVCAEIGVDKGEFSQKIIDRVQPTKLHTIDPWKYEEGETYQRSRYGGKRGENQVNMDRRYEAVVERFRSQIESDRVIIHRGYSHEVCSEFQSNYFDWIYIDGNHLYEFVKQDLELYYRTVKEGGLITGDDYRDGGWWQGGVKKAVDEFVAKGFVEAIEIKGGQFILKKKSMDNSQGSAK
ncbi:MAG: class I SAM-dependent methyltransferase [Hormoscilla sp. GUM202]|nr:class I SAM-dependent methyltransferase [Hormoscilla sp. GUM202]